MNSVLKRASGVLLHPTSLPGAHGIGDIGREALKWLDFLKDSGQKYWQICPLGHTGYGDSPYQCFSAFAGNPLLISIQTLLDEALLSADDLTGQPASDPRRVDYGALYHWKYLVLRKAYARFIDQGLFGSAEFTAWREAETLWLDDYCLYMAIKTAHGGQSWQQWEVPLKRRETAALASARSDLADDISFYAFLQYTFDRQWKSLKAAADERGITIIGDVPIFTAMDSADAWASPHHFQFDRNLEPVVVAGVPPDYFSATGQLWGNPLYNWDAMKKDRYRFWVSRMKRALQFCGLLRLDHFRGFAAYWAVPAGEKTAVKGSWVEGPGRDLFEALNHALGQLPLLAEDLGVITPDVEALRDTYGFPGMKILQFAFDSGPENAYLPHNYSGPAVVYTGTHDNDTTRGWYESLDEAIRSRAEDYVPEVTGTFALDMVHYAWASSGLLALAPLQDLLNLGKEARMNTPGQAAGNWQWRFTWKDVPTGIGALLAEWTEKYHRL